MRHRLKGTKTLVLGILSAIGLSATAVPAQAKIASCTPLTKTQRAYYKFHPGHYIAIGGIKFKDAEGNLLEAPVDPLPDALEEIQDIDGLVGIQRRYYWSDLNPRRGVYNFTRVLQDLEAARLKGKKLAIMIMWKFGNDKGDSPVPAYLSKLTGTLPHEYEIDGPGEFAKGYIAALDNDVVANELANFLARLAAEIDDKENLSSVAFGETATATNFAELNGLPQKAGARDRFYENLVAVGQRANCAFKHTPVLQFFNYPGDKIRMMAEGFKSHGTAAGGPDTWLNDKDIEKSYALFPEVKAVAPIGMIVAGGNQGYVNHTGEYSKDPELALPADPQEKVRLLADKAVTQLGANYVFWRRVSAKDAVYKTVKNFIVSGDARLPKADGTCPSMQKGICRYK